MSKRRTVLIPLDPIAYANTPRPERRAIAKQLAELRAVRQKSEPIRQKFRLELEAAKQATLPREQFAQFEALKRRWQGLDRLLVDVAPSVELLACAVCNRSTAHCICLDADGQPLNWGALS